MGSRPFRRGIGGTNKKTKNDEIGLFSRSQGSGGSAMLEAINQPPVSAYPKAPLTQGVMGEIRHVKRKNGA
jgi:hypothetical protein